MVLNPSIIGTESTEFLQTSPPDAMMLIIAMEASFGDVSGPIRIAVPYYTLEPVVSRLLTAVSVPEKKLLNLQDGTKSMTRFQLMFRLVRMLLNSHLKIYLISKLMMLLNSVLI